MHGLLDARVSAKVRIESNLVAVILLTKKVDLGEQSPPDGCCDERIESDVLLGGGHGGEFIGTCGEQCRSGGIVGPEVVYVSQ